MDNLSDFLPYVISYMVREEDCRLARHIARINLIRNTVAISALTLELQAGLREETKVEALKYRLTTHE